MKYKTAVAIGMLLALIAVVVTLTNVPALVKAQTGGAEKAPMPSPAVSVGPAVVGVNHVLKATYINSCMPSCSIITVAAGATVPLDGVTTISCPAPIGHTCTITDDAWVELNNTSTTTNNPESLGFYVDGALTDAFYDGGGGTPGGFFFDAIAHKTAVAVGVSRGTHTVQTQTFSVSGAKADAFTATYRVYAP